MIIAFLDLLGFSWLVNNYPEDASDLLYKASVITETKFRDNKVHPIEKYEEDSLREFASDSSITSFSYLIEVSDSLIIAADDSSLFIKQICNLLSTFYIRSTEAVTRPFDSIEELQARYNLPSLPNVIIRNRKSIFPLLYRGGISVGDVEFSKSNQIIDYNQNMNGLTIIGKDYIDAVKLEQFDKGPRLFCSEKFYNESKNEDKKYFKQIKNENGDRCYELLWAFFAFEATERSSDKHHNLIRGLRQNLLPAAINLYNFYKSDEKNSIQYLELGKTIYSSSILYALEHGIDLSEVDHIFNEIAPQFVN